MSMAQCKLNTIQAEPSQARSPLSTNRNTHSIRYPKHNAHLTLAQHTHMYARRYTRRDARTHARMYARMHARMHACMYSRSHAHTCIKHTTQIPKHTQHLHSTLGPNDHNSLPSLSLLTNHPHTGSSHQPNPLPTSPLPTQATSSSASQHPSNHRLHHPPMPGPKLN